MTAGRPQKSSDTVRSIFRNNDPASLLIACVGFCSAAVQTVYFREMLSVFSGNELSVGIIFSVWLLATGAGAALANAKTRDPAKPPPNTPPPKITVLIMLLCCSAVAGFFLIRASRLAIGGGETFGPVAMLAIASISSVPFAFVNGRIIGALFSSGQRPQRLYGWENAGTTAGALAVFICILFYANNGYLAALALLPFAAIALRRFLVFGIVFCCIACVLLGDRPSVQWKYSMPAGCPVYGREGEIVRFINGIDTTFLLNGSVYKSTLEKPLLEQAVHVPMAQRPHAGRVLVAFDRGHCAELAKYKAVIVDNIETEPVFAGRGARVAAVETFRPDKRYDVIFLGSGLPRTSSSNRFYTRSFFQKMKSLLSDSGLITFSLPFSENYFSPAQQRLYDALRSTLETAFKNVLVLPGEGYTFMASDGRLAALPAIQVPTEYLSSSILPGISAERIKIANKKPVHGLINTHDRPITLLLGLAGWLEFFPGSTWLLFALLGASLIIVIMVLPKSRDTLSVATSGFTIGVYSVCLLLLYQATYGALYSRISLLLVSLTAGFALGSLVKRFRLSDLAIGLYAIASLCILSLLSYPAAFLFYLFHAGIGVLAAGQFVTRKKTPAASLYAADCFGGALGMAACSTLLVPLFGIIPVAAGLLLLKGSVEAAIHCSGKP